MNTFVDSLHCSIRSRWRHLAVSVLIASLSPTVLADTPNIVARVVDARVDLSRLAPDAMSDEVCFVIDDGDNVTIRIWATIADLVTFVEGSNEEILDPDTVEGFGGTYVEFEGHDFGVPVISSLNEPEFHYDYDFPTLGPGTYTVPFGRPARVERGSGRGHPRAYG